MFEYENDIYIISRKNLKGNATEVEFPNKKQRRKNLIRYSFSKNNLFI